MKTTEQIKSEAITYLSKTSQHTFINKKGDLYKVLLEGNLYITINGDKISIGNIDNNIKQNAVNTKCLIKHFLFLYPSLSSGYPSERNNQLTSIKSFKKMKERVDIIKSSILGKTDKDEIKRIITNLKFLHVY